MPAKLETRPEYYAWRDLVRRCTHPTHKQWADYGGRGIKVCDRWLGSFANFLADVGRRPSPSLTIDRVDNDGDYEPGNVRWATRDQQNANRRKPRGSVPGATKKRNKWQAQIGINGRNVYLGLFNSPDEATVAYLTAKLARGIP